MTMNHTSYRLEACESCRGAEASGALRTATASVGNITSKTTDLLVSAQGREQVPALLRVRHALQAHHRHVGAHRHHDVGVVHREARRVGGVERHQVPAQGRTSLKTKGTR